MELSLIPRSYRALLQAELDAKTERAESAEWMMGAGGEHAHRKLTRTAGGFFRALI